MPSAAIRSTRRCTIVLSSFMLGMPYMSKPPMRSARSKTVTLWPARFSCAAHAKPGGSRADDRDFLASALGGRLRSDPALCQAVVDDRALDVLDRDRWPFNAEHARAFARRRTNPAGEFREIVGLVQALERFFPKSAIDQIVPFRNQVVDRATGSHAADQWPVWQNGMPQSMQRAPWSRSLSSVKCSWNSFQSLIRSKGERSSGSSRYIP